MSNNTSGGAFISFTKTYIATHRCRGRNGFGEQCDFVPLAALHQHWSEESIFNLLCESSSSRAGRAPESPKVIQEKYLVVFSILVSIGQLESISSFTEADLSDCKLPFLSLPGSWADNSEQVELFYEFSKEQWKFCPLSFDTKPYKATLDPNQIIPVTKKEPLAPLEDEKDGVFLYKVDIHQDCRGILPSPTIVFKEYHSHQDGVHDFFQNEVDVYSHLREDSFDNIVKYYGSFQTVGVHTLMLEYANAGTLADFFSGTPPIDRPADRLFFWKGFLGLLRGLDDIHNLTNPETPTGKWILRATHQDIRPQNILVFKREDTSNPYHVVFKWTDFGTGHVRKCRNKGYDLLGKNHEGNGMYSAPECFRDDNIQRPVFGKSDVWSFGGVASEAIVWSILGDNERDNYQNLRSQENRHGPLNGGLHEGAFHDGQCLLKAVDKMHQEALLKRHSDDIISHEVIDLITKNMLVADPQDRKSAMDVYSQWEKLQPNLAPAVITRNFGQWPARLRIVTRSQEDTEDSGYLPESSHGKLRSYAGSSNPVRSSDFNDQLGIRQQLTYSSSFKESTRFDEYDHNRLSPQTPRTPDLRLIPPYHNISRRPDEQQDLSNGEPALFSYPQTPNSKAPISHESSSYHSNPALMAPRPSSLRTHHDLDRFHGRKGSYESTRSPTPTMIDSEAQTYPVRMDHPVSTLYSNTDLPSNLPSNSRIRQITVDEIWTKCLKYKRGPPLSLRRSLSNSSPDLLQQFPELKQTLEQVKGPGGCPRDQVFLVDDSISMEKHRDLMGKTCRVLSYMSKKGKVDNLFELYYSVSTDVVKDGHSTPLQESIDQHQFSEKPSSLARTLDSIVSNLIRQAKPVSIYVLTNGEWNSHDANDLCGVDLAVKRLVKHISDKNKEENWAGIQFIRFYDPKDPQMDTLGKTRLKYLDDELTTQFKKSQVEPNDIVDTCDWDSDVRKMLLGCVLKEED